MIRDEKCQTPTQTTPPRRMVKRSFTGDSRMTMMRQRSRRALSLFQKSEQGNIAEDGGDSSFKSPLKNDPPSRSACFRRNCSLRKLMCHADDDEEPMHNSSTSNTSSMCESSESSSPTGDSNSPSRNNRRDQFKRASSGSAPRRGLGFYSKSKSSSNLSDFASTLSNMTSSTLSSVTVMTFGDANDAKDDKTMDEMDILTHDLERMARMLGKVDNPEKILSKHLKPKTKCNKAA